MAGTGARGVRWVERVAGVCLLTACSNVAGYAVPLTEVRCDDGQDDDLDGRADCSDPDCASACGVEGAVRLTVVVTDAVIGSSAQPPVNGATVCVFERPALPCATTDARGVAEVAVPRGEAVALRVDGEGYTSAILPLFFRDPTDAEALLVPLTSEPQTAVLFGNAGLDFDPAAASLRVQLGTGRRGNGWAEPPVQLAPAPQAGPAFPSGELLAVATYDERAIVDVRVGERCRHDPPWSGWPLPDEPGDGAPPAPVRAPVVPGAVTTAARFVCD